MSDAAAISEKPERREEGKTLTDFKDWLSPMLVKELRQGMRTRVFVMAFILLQAAMLVVMLAAAGNGSPGRATSAIWFVTAVVLLAAMPLRGFAALSNEMRMRTMDLLTLTRLSAFRITFGKWAALYSQTLLLAVALLPYVVIRYFLGGVDLANELILLGFLTILSGVLTALTVGFSAHQSILLRSAVALLVMMFGTMGIGELISDMLRGGSSSMVTLEGFWWVVLAALAFAVFVTYYLLDMGASQFAPFAENHATRKRIAGLLFIGVMFLCALVADESWYPEALFMLMVLSMIVVCVDALTERPAPVPSVYLPFVRRGLPGRLLGKLFYPGWHTGLIYLALVVLLLLLFSSLFDVEIIGDSDALAAALALLGTILFPVLLLRLFFRNHPAPFALYVLIQCITVPLVLLLMSIDDGGGLLWIACPIPFVQFCIIESGYQYGDIGPALPALFTLGYFAILLVLSMSEHREARALERIAEATLDEEDKIEPAAGEGGAEGA